MTKTILFISPTGTLDNGAEISIVNLMKFLVKKGYRVLNVFPDYKVPSQEEYQIELQKAGIETHGLLAVKWWWEEAPGGSPGNHYERIQGYKKNIRDLKKIIISEDVNLVISNTVNVFQGAVATAELGVRHFWLIHEFPEGEFAYYREKLDFISYYSDQIFSVSGALNEDLTNLLPKRKILNFIPFSYVKKINLKSAENSRIVQIGRITDNKNQIELLKAYQKLNINIPLVFIGAEDESYLKKCKDYIKSHGLNNVQFLGYRENPWFEVSEKDICVFTSKIETFGMVYIESLLNGIPTIVSNNKGYESVKEIFSEGEMYPLGNTDALSKMILDFLTNFDEKKQEMIHSREKILKLYSLDYAYREIIQQVNLDVPCKSKDYEKYLYFLNVKVTMKDRLKQLLKNLVKLKKLR